MVVKKHDLQSVVKYDSCRHTLLHYLTLSLFTISFYPSYPPQSSPFSLPPLHLPLPLPLPPPPPSPLSLVDNVEMEIVSPWSMTVVKSLDIALALQHKIETMEIAFVYTWTT